MSRTRNGSNNNNNNNNNKNSLNEGSDGSRTPDSTDASPIRNCDETKNGFQNMNIMDYATNGLMD